MQSRSILGYKRSIAINHRKNQEDGDLHDVCKDERQIYARKRCKGCPYDNICPKKIEDCKPFLLRWITDRFHDKRRNVNYKDRLPISEGINGFHKTSDGIIKFVVTTLTAIENEYDLRNAIYNLIRMETFKEEGY